jgi:hypothetical protein
VTERWRYSANGRDRYETERRQKERQRGKSGEGDRWVHNKLERKEKGINMKEEND